MMTFILKNTQSPLSNVLVRIVEQGDGYGQYSEKTGFALTHSKENPLVEFYDLDNDHAPFGGQFVSRYYLDTLLDGGDSGLCLDGGEPKWNLKASEMIQIRQFLRVVKAQVTDALILA